MPLQAAMPLQARVAMPLQVQVAMPLQVQVAMPLQVQGAVLSPSSKRFEYDGGVRQFILPCHLRFQSSSCLVVSLKLET